MEITIKIGENELIHPQMALAISAQLESRVNDEGVGLNELTPGKVLPFDGVKVAPPNTEEPKHEAEPEITYTLEGLRAMAIAIATANKSSKAVMDIIEEASGLRKISETDDTHYQTVGAAFTLALEVINE